MGVEAGEDDKGKEDGVGLPLIGDVQLIFKTPKSYKSIETINRLL